jgi:addiction module HigA family antidote
MSSTPIHPGEHLAEELSVLGLSAAALARHLKVPTNRITQILNGRRAISGDTAIRLAHFFGTSAQFWMNLQTLYEVKCAQNKVGKTLRTLSTIQVLRRTA